MNRLSRVRLVLSLAAALVAVPAACSRSSVADDTETVRPEPIGDHECAACGMIVARQPSPRGQVAHRDGTHEFFCSVADMIVYLDAPSPHGEVVATWVETVPADIDPESLSAEERPWSDADTAHFVIGDFHRRVMGRPVLVLGDATEAASVATRLEGQVVTWSELPAYVD